MENILNQAVELKGAYIKVAITVDIESLNNQVVITNNQYYHFEVVETAAGDNYKELIPLLKSLKNAGRIRMITIDVLGGSTKLSHQYNVYSMRLIDSGMNQVKVAKWNGEKYDFDACDPIEMEAAAFVEKYGPMANQMAMYTYVETLQEAHPTMGDFDPEGN